MSWAGKGVLIRSKERKCAGGAVGAVLDLWESGLQFLQKTANLGGSGLYKAANLTVLPEEMKEKRVEWFGK